MGRRPISGSDPVLRRARRGVGSCRGSDLTGRHRPRASENHHPVTAGVVAGRAHGERLAVARDRVRPGPQRVSIRAEAATVAVSVRRVLDSGTHLHASARLVADIEELAAAFGVVQLPSRQADLQPPMARWRWLARGRFVHVSRGDDTRPCPRERSGWAAGAVTDAFTVLVAMCPSVVIIRTVNVCSPGLRNE